jgi:hypothetical protein
MIICSNSYLLSTFPDYYSLHINCGGKSTIVGKNIFEADEDSAGSAKFVPSNENWGTSSTGDFWDVNRNVNDYTANNVSILSVNDSELYMTARLSALSLTYYGRCLANGNYTVTLHFAEIVLRDNRSFQSLGKWMFDVYIQVNLEYLQPLVLSCFLSDFSCAFVTGRTKTKGF